MIAGVNGPSSRSIYRQSARHAASLTEMHSPHRILVHAVHQLGLRGDGGMRAGHLHPIAVGDAQAFTARPVDVEQVLAEAGWNRMSVPPMALFRQSVFRWQNPKPDQTGGPDRPDVSSFEPDTHLCAVSSRCTASLSPGCSRHDPQQHGEHGR